MAATRLTHFALCIVLVAGHLRPVYSIKNKCSACVAVARELVKVLADEKPRNHLDMRNRLNSQGKREGKVIEYRVSELRMVEILDGLCKRVEKYSLKLVSTRKVWLPTQGSDQLSPRLRLITEEQGKELKRWCDRLLEEEEDRLADMIRGSKEEMYEDVPLSLCEKVTANCKAGQFEKENATMAKAQTPPKDVNVTVSNNKGNSEVSVDVGAEAKQPDGNDKEQVNPPADGITHNREDL